MNDNIPSNGLIEFKFTGEGMLPENVKASEIADILKAIEDMLETRIFQDHPELDKGQLIIGLVKVKSESLGLQFQSPIPEYAQKAFREVGNSVKTGDTISLPPKSRNALSNIVRFTRNKKCTTDFIISSNGFQELLATITPETKVEYPPLLRGDTTVYAKVVRTGGVEPKVELETVDGRTLFCDAPLEITKFLGTKLYQIVGLIGIAEWDSELNNIEQFSIKDVTDYEKVSLKEAMHALTEATKTYYADVDDVEQHISTLRGHDLE